MKKVRITVKKIARYEDLIRNCTGSKISCKVSDLNGVNGNDTFSPHSPKVVTEDWISKQQIR